MEGDRLTLFAPRADSTGPASDQTWYHTENARGLKGDRFEWKRGNNAKYEAKFVYPSEPPSGQESSTTFKVLPGGSVQIFDQSVQSSEQSPGSTLTENKSTFKGVTIAGAAESSTQIGRMVVMGQF